MATVKEMLRAGAIVGTALAVALSTFAFVFLFLPH